MCKGWSRVGLNKMIEFWNGPMEERLMWKAKFGSSLQALHAFNALEEGGYLFDHAQATCGGGKREGVSFFSWKGERQSSAAFLQEGGPFIDFTHLGGVA